MYLVERESKKENKSKYLYYEKDDIKIKCFVESGRILLSGSIHKYFNKGFHNYSIFTHQDYNNALERLKNDFGVEPKDLRLLQLEYGVNIKPPIPTKLILDNLFLFKTTQIENKIRDTRNSHYNQFRLSKFVVKIYDKAIQYKLNDNLMRFEIKHTDWSTYRLENKIITLNDFNNYDKTIFIDNLIQKWNEILFYDPTIITDDKWNKYSNINYWRYINQETKQLSKHRQRLKELIRTQSQNIKSQISNLILENIKGVQNFNLSKIKVCKLTGIDISTQRETSFLLSHTGLKTLIETNPKEYQRIKNIFLSDNWATSSTDKQIKEIAHNIRAKYNYQQKRHSNQIDIFNMVGVQNFNFIYT